METSTKRNKKAFTIGIIAILLVIIVVVIAATSNSNKEKVPTIDVTTSLEKIVTTSDLSTVEFTYQGIVEVPNPKKPQNIDYYICYEAVVYAGIDFSKIKFKEDQENKTITAKLPEVVIQDIVVDPDKLDFMFMRKKADNEDVLTTALTACETDIRQECTSESALMETAQMNAKNVIRALAEPVIEQLNNEYTLEVE